MDKCFCHLNGFAVKDATARKQIEELTKRIEALENGTQPDEPEDPFNPPVEDNEPTMHIFSVTLIDSITNGEITTLTGESESSEARLVVEDNTISLVIGSVICDYITMSEEYFTDISLSKYVLTTATTDVFVSYTVPTKPETVTFTVVDDEYNINKTFEVAPSTKWSEFADTSYSGSLGGHAFFIENGLIAEYESCKFVSDSKDYVSPDDEIRSEIYTLEY